MEMKKGSPKVCIHQTDASICHLHALFGIIIALIIASILPFAFGYRKVKPKIIKEEPPESDRDAPEFRGCLTIQNPSKNIEIIGL